MLLIVVDLLRKCKDKQTKIMMMLIFIEINLLKKIK